MNIDIKWSCSRSLNSKSINGPADWSKKNLLSQIILKEMCQLKTRHGRTPKSTEMQCVTTTTNVQYTSKQCLVKEIKTWVKKLAAQGNLIQGHCQEKVSQHSWLGRPTSPADCIPSLSNQPIKIHHFWFSNPYIPYVYHHHHGSNSRPSCGEMHDT